MDQIDLEGGTPVVDSANDDSNDDKAEESEDSDGEDSDHDSAVDTGINGADQRRLCIQRAGGIKTIISMLDGSNLNPKEPLKPATVGGWGAVRVGIAGCQEIAERFPGSQVDFGMRIGMQEQAASTLSPAYDDELMQDAIILDDGLPSLLSLVRLAVPWRKSLQHRPCGTYRPIR